MESEQPEVSRDQGVNSNSVSQNDGGPRRKRDLTNPPADEGLHYKCFQIRKEEDAHK